MPLRFLALVCACCTLAVRVRAGEVTQARIDEAIERGVQGLLRLYADGFGRGRAGLPQGPELVDRPGLRALTAYTLVKSGLPKEHPVVERLLTRLSFETVTGTYDRACLLMALEAVGGDETRAWIAELAQALIASQEARGDWGYPGGGDLSNTQYAALGLRAAENAGVEVPRETWRKLARAVLAYRANDGGFGYSPGASASYGSMTTAGIGTLAICEAELARARALDGELERELPRARASGWRWLDEHFTVEENPGGPGWLHYYLYGLERAGALANVERVGDHGWYTEGARVLLDTQGGDGDWAGTFERESTLFALLFLRRATSTSAPRTVEPGATRVERDGVVLAGPVWFATEGTGPVRLSIEGFSPELRRELERPAERGLGLRVVRVEYLASEVPVAVVLGDPDHPSGAQRFEAVCSTLPPGKQELRARVLVREPRKRADEQRDARPRGPREGGKAPNGRAPRKGTAKRSMDDEDELGPVRVITSGVAVVDVREAFTRHSRAESPPSIALRTAQASATSTLSRWIEVVGFDFGARSAVDGNPRNPWIADPKDATPMLRVTLRTPIRADRVRVRPAQLLPRTPDRLVTPSEVVIVVNADPPRTLALGKDGGELRLGREVDVRVVELRIPAKPGAEQVFGIGEVELALDGS